MRNLQELTEDRWGRRIGIAINLPEERVICYKGCDGILRPRRGSYQI